MLEGTSGLTPTDCSEWGHPQLQQSKSSLLWFESVSPCPICAHWTPQGPTYAATAAPGVTRSSQCCLLLCVPAAVCVRAQCSTAGSAVCSCGCPAWCPVCACSAAVTQSPVCVVWVLAAALCPGVSSRQCLLQGCGALQTAL